MIPQASKTLCAWCGRALVKTGNGKLKPHLNGARICVGSGQSESTHIAVRERNAKIRSAQSIPNR